MSTPFARTLRALDADDFRVSNAFVLLVLALLAAWTWWLFTGSVAQYESSTHVRVEPNRFIASFPARVLNQVRPGQPASLDLDGASVPARVAAIGLDASTGQVQVVLLPSTESPVAASAKSAQASVEVARVTPSTLMLRAIGRVGR